MSASALHPMMPKDKTDKSTWWRDVLGEYATGVVLVTGRDPDTGDAIGMVAGSFAAVSDVPPIVSFMAARSSVNYQSLRRAGRFCVSVLGAQQLELCTSFARDPASRFTVGAWAETDNGDPRLANAVVWFDAQIERVVEAGDHDIVLGRVSSYGVGGGEAGRPLLYLRGGYGTFAVPSPETDARSFAASVRQAELLRTAVDDTACELDVLCFVATVVKDSVVILAAANNEGIPGGDLVGQVFPFAAPVGAVMAAWAPPERVRLWQENARHLLGVVDRPRLEWILDRARRDGYAHTSGGSVEAFDEIMSDPAASPADVSRIWKEVDAGERRQVSGAVRAISVPVFDAAGHAQFELYLSSSEGAFSQARLDAVRQRAIQIAAELTAEIGGNLPPEYALALEPSSLE